MWIQLQIQGLEIHAGSNAGLNFSESFNFFYYMIKLKKNIFGILITDLDPGGRVVDPK